MDIEITVEKDDFSVPMGHTTGGGQLKDADDVKDNDGNYLCYNWKSRTRLATMPSGRTNSGECFRIVLLDHHTMCRRLIPQMIAR